MLFIYILLGWIAGICTLGLVLPEFLFLPKPIIWIICIIGILLKIGQRLQDSKSSSAKNRVASHMPTSIALQSLFAISMSLAGFYLGQEYAQQHLEQRLQQRIPQVSEQDLLVYVHRLSQSNATAPDLPVKQQVAVLGPWDPHSSQREISSDFQASQSKELLLMLTPQQTETMQLGQYYRVRGEVKPAHSYAVSGVFDLEKWYLQQNLAGTMWVRQLETIPASAIDPIQFHHQLRQHRTFWHQFKIHVEQVRLDMRQQIYQSPLQNKGLLLGLLTGDDSLLSHTTKQQFKTLGISHLLAISGPHVLVFAAMVCWILTTGLNRFMPRLWLIIPRPYFMVLPFVGCVLLYSLFTGLEIPALRTTLTVVLISSLILIQQRVRTWKVLLSSAALLLWLDPFSILSAAFWLSYGACFILIRVYQTIQHSPQSGLSAADRLSKSLHVLIESQWKIFIALFPLTLLIFQQVSWIAPLVNLIAIPMIGAVVVPLEVLACMLSSLPPLSQFLFQLADFFLSVLLLILSTLQQLLGIKLSWLALSPLMILLLTVAVLILFLPRGILPKSWAVLCCIPVFLGSFNRSPVELEVLDVGQGQAIYLRSGTWRMLLDTGGRHHEEQSGIGEQVLIPHFMSRAIQQLDLVILSHLDQDHAGAFTSLKEQITVKRVMSNEQDQRFTGLDFLYCHQGQNFQQDGVNIRILSPEIPIQLNTPVNTDRNEASCVIYIQIPFSKSFQNFLVMGDAGWETEYRLMQQYPDLKVDVLVLGHHGSRHSSSFAFLQHYQPKLAIASAGFNNRYQHPHPLLKARLKQLQIPLKTTIDAGSLQFLVKANGEMEMNEYRLQRQWLQRPLQQ